MKMKKILVLFGALAILSASCSSDDDVSSVLIKKIIETDLNGNTYNKVDYTYNGQKIQEEIHSEKAYNYKRTYSYDENLISSIAETSEGKVVTITDFTYNGNELKTKLVTEFYETQKIITKTYYTHNIDGSVSYKIVSVNAQTNEETDPINFKLTFSDGNLIKEELAGLQTRTVVYEYDTKNNPLLNIKGFAELLDNTELGYSKHNKTKQTTNSSNSGTSVYSSVFTYDKKDFPVEAKHFDQGGAAGSTQYFY